MDTNLLYYGDNLDFLRRYVPDGAVDLVYLDPPFNSNRDYNVIGSVESGNGTDAHLRALQPCRASTPLECYSAVERRQSL